MLQRGDKLLEGRVLATGGGGAAGAADLGRNLALAELVQAAGLSESWLAHGFRQATGETPQRWQLRLRLEEARAAMADPARSLSDIAHACGFADQAHFTRHFKARTGVTPAVFRNG